MPSPFPGMNPYLEQETVWHDFHERFLPAAATALVPQIRPKYIVVIDENIYLHDLPTGERRPIGRPDLTLARSEAPTIARRSAAVGILEAPAQVMIPDEDVESLSYLKILDRVSRELITVVELISPTNKRSGDHRYQYLNKRAIIRQGPAHLVEIDLLRGGKPLPAEDRPECDYSVLVSRADRRPRADFWPIRLRDPLPTIPVPLRPEDGEARLDLQALLHRVYDESGYEDYIYRREPDPPLSGDDAGWARSCLPSLPGEAGRPRGSLTQPLLHDPPGRGIEPGDLFGGARADERSALVPRAGAEVDDPVGARP